MEKSFKRQKEIDKGSQHLTKLYKKARDLRRIFNELENELDEQENAGKPDHIKDNVNLFPNQRLRSGTICFGSSYMTDTSSEKPNRTNASTYIMYYCEVGGFGDRVTNLSVSFLLVRMYVTIFKNIGLLLNAKSNKCFCHVLL